MNKPVLLTVVIIVTIAVHALGAYLLQTNPELVDTLFGSSDSELAVSGDELEAILDDLRIDIRDDWTVTLHALEEHAEEIEAHRERMMTELRESRMGDAYADEMEILLEDRHEPLFDVDLGPDSTMVDVYFAVQNAELRMTNGYIDIIAIRTAMEHEVPAIEAVNFARVVQPDRRPLDDAMRRLLLEPIRTTRDGRLDRFRSSVLAYGSEIDAILRYGETIMDNLDAELDQGEEGIQVVMDGGDGGSVLGDTLRPDELNLFDQGTQSNSFGQRPGRTLSADATNNYNMYIDRWYVMGPFENRFRQAIDASFLPESIVDLDHTTIGKDQREISWEYWRIPYREGNVGRVEPQTGAPRGSVYYGFTEVYVEEEGLYWVSLGSDDFGRMWLNGDMVWESSREPKSWRDNEWTGELHFQQGINQILFRCENHGGTMGWSVILHAEAY